MTRIACDSTWVTLGFHTFIAQQIHLYEQRDWLILKHKNGALGAPKEKENITQNTHPDVLSQMGTYMSIKEPEDDGMYSEAKRQSHNLIDFSDTTNSQVYDNRAGVFGLLFLFSTVFLASEFGMMLCSVMEDVICDFLWGFRLSSSFRSVWCYVLWWRWWSLLYNSDILCFWADWLHFCHIWL